MVRGEDPVLLCAHMDTVFTDPPIAIFYDQQQEVMWAPYGLGADDRAGIFAIIEIIMDGYHPSILFTTNEEIGCLGAKAIVKDYPECPVDVRCIIQLDREGQNDSIYYGCDNKQFKFWIESAGFEEDKGTYTDISILCPAWKIAGVNLSVGYYLEHTSSEYLRVNELEKTILKVKSLIARSHELDETFIYIQDEEYINPFSYRPKCILCDRIIDISEKYYMGFQDNNTLYYCDKCATKYKLI